MYIYIYKYIYIFIYAYTHTHTHSIAHTNYSRSVPSALIVAPQVYIHKHIICIIFLYMYE